MTRDTWNRWAGFGLAALLIAGCGAPAAVPTAVDHPALALAAARHVLDTPIPLIPKHMSNYSASSERKGYIYGKYSADRPLGGGNPKDWNKEWATAGDRAPNGWLAVNFDGAYNLTTMTIKANRLGATTYQVQTTTDGSTWTTVLTGQNAGTLYNTDTISFPPGTTASGVRIYWTNDPDTPIEYFAIYGLQIYGIPASTSSSGGLLFPPGSGGIPGVV